MAMLVITRWYSFFYPSVGYMLDHWWTWNFSYPTWSKHCFFFWINVPTSSHRWWRPFRSFVTDGLETQERLAFRMFWWRGWSGTGRAMDFFCLTTCFGLILLGSKHLGRVPCVTPLRTCLEQAAAVSQASEKSENSEDIAMLLARWQGNCQLPVPWNATSDVKRLPSCHILSSNVAGKSPKTIGRMIYHVGFFEQPWLIWLITGG